MLNGQYGIRTPSVWLGKRHDASVQDKDGGPRTGDTGNRNVKAWAFGCADLWLDLSYVAVDGSISVDAGPSWLMARCLMMCQESRVSFE